MSESEANGHNAAHGDLPEGWRSGTLIDAAHVTMGQSPPGSSYNEIGDGEPFFQGKAEFGALHPTVRKWTTAGTRFAQNGDILMSVRAPVGPTNVADIDCVIGRGLAGIRAREHVDQTFLLWNLRHFEHEIAAKGTGTTFDSISGNDLKSQGLSIPPLAEQERIVEILEEQLSHLDAALESVRVVREKAAQFRRSLLHAAFTGTLTGHNPADGQLPEGWTLVQWSEVLAPGKESFRRGPFGSALKKSIFVESGYKVYEQSTAINDDCSLGRYRISAEKYAELSAFAVATGDFLISCSGTIGRITQVPVEFEEGVINQALLRVRIDQSKMSDVFFRAIFESPEFQNQILQHSTGTAMSNVKGVKELKEIEFLVPPLAEQEQIVEILEEQLSRLDAALAVADAIEKRSAALRRSLLHAAFTGRLTEKWRELSHV
jgi:type I restriction enzyme S subunit